MPLQDGIDRAPVDACALHPNVRHCRRPQPVPQRFEVPRHGAKRPHLLGRLRPRRADQKARHDRLLMTSRPQHRSMIACIIASFRQTRRSVKSYAKPALTAYCKQPWSQHLPGSEEEVARIRWVIGIRHPLPGLDLAVVASGKGRLLDGSIASL